MSLSVLLTTGTTFYYLPNEIITGWIFVFAMLIGTLLVRTLYILMHRKHRYPNDQIYLVVLGAKLIKVIAVLMIIALALLGFRVDPGTRADQFWELDSLSRGWWCIIRMAIGLLAALCASVFESHWLFRAWSTLTVPLCSVLDLVSEAHLAMQISCIDHGLCEPDPDKEKELYLLAWRDIMSAIITLIYFGVSAWLWFLFGVFQNDIVMPRAEHRAMSAQLDQMKHRLKPKEMRRSAAAGGGARPMISEEENQLEKMLGYN